MPVLPPALPPLAPVVPVAPSGVGPRRSLAGIPWILGTLLSAYGYRRGGTRGNAIRGLLGTIIGVLLLGATVTSTVLYGAGTDGLTTRHVCAPATWVRPGC